MILQKPLACSGCALQHLGSGFVPPQHPDHIHWNGVSIVGMAPARTEVERGEPFVGRAGTILSRILRSIAPRAHFDIRNVLQCQGPSDDLNWSNIEDAIEHCAVHRESYERAPQVRVAMGAVPFYVLAPEHGRHDGKKWTGVPISKARGYRFETESGPVVPTFHPSYLGRGNMNLIPVVIWDIVRALEERRRSAPAFPLDHLMLYPTPSEFIEWLQAGERSSFLVHDIETAYSRRFDEDDEEQDSSYEITRFSLADDKFRAITAPYQEPFITILKEFLSDVNIPRVGWNSHEFDDPREKHNGWPMRGERVDARWLWHFLQPSLPQSLGAVSTFYTRVPEWKSIGSSKGTDDELYSAMDAWATAKCYVGIRNALRAREIHIPEWRQSVSER